MTTAPQPTPINAMLSQRLRFGGWQVADVAAWLAPLAVVMTVISVSPNFDNSSPVRPSPLGSDFLQDWVGAKIVTSTDRELLYHATHYQALQHDAEVVGFAWPEQQYYPMVYPPFFYSMLRPLAALPYQTALWWWMLLQAAGLGITLTLIRNFQPTRRHFVVFLAASLLFAPLLTSLNMAHKSVFVLLIFTATFVLLYRQKHFAAGLVFGLLAFKPHLAILLGLGMLFKRQWNFVSGATVTVSILLISSLACGLDVCFDYLRQTLSAGAYWQHAGYRLCDAVNVNAVAQLATGTTGWMSHSITLASFLAVTGALCCSWRGPIKTNSQSFAIQYSIVMLATPLLSPHFYIYDLTIMLLPFLLLILAMRPNRQGQKAEMLKRNRAFSIVVALVAIFFLASGFFSSFAEMSGIQLATLLVAMLIVAATWHLMLGDDEQVVFGS